MVVNVICSPPPKTDWRSINFLLFNRLAGYIESVAITSSPVWRTLNSLYSYSQRFYSESVFPFSGFWRRGNTIFPVHKFIRLAYATLSRGDVLFCFVWTTTMASLCPQLPHYKDRMSRWPCCCSSQFNSFTNQHTISLYLVQDAAAADDECRKSATIGGWRLTELTYELMHRVW